MYQILCDVIKMKIKRIFVVSVPKIDLHKTKVLKTQTRVLTSFQLNQ